MSIVSQIDIHASPCLAMFLPIMILQGTPIDMPYLEGFPPKEELPSVTWTSKFVSSLVRTVLGSIRYRTL